VVVTALPPSTGLMGSSYQARPSKVHSKNTSPDTPAGGALGDADGLMLAEGETEAEGERLTLAEGEALTLAEGLAETEAEGLAEAEGDPLTEAEGLALALSAAA